MKNLRKQPRNLTLSFLAIFAAILFVFAFTSSSFAENSQAKPKPSEAPLGQAGVLKSVDKITLKDGTVIKGKIIAEGKKAVVIIVTKGDSAQERAIKMSKVAKIEKGQQSPETEYYETGVVDGEEKVVKKKKTRSTSSTSSSSSTTTKTPNRSTKTTTKTTKTTKSSSSSSKKLTSSTKTEDLLRELKKSKKFAGLAKVIGDKAMIKTINNTKKNKHFKKMLDNFNKNKEVKNRDISDLFRNSRVKLDSSTRKKALRYISDLTWSK